MNNPIELYACAVCDEVYDDCDAASDCCESYTEVYACSVCGAQHEIILFAKNCCDDEASKYKADKKALEDAGQKRLL